MNKASKKIKKDKCNAGRPRLSQISAEPRFSLEELWQNPRLAFSLTLPSNIIKLIFESPSLHRIRENNANNSQNFEITSYPDERRYPQMDYRGKREFFDFMTLILKVSSSHLRLNEDCQECLSWCLERFVDEMEDFNVVKEGRWQRNFREFSRSLVDRSFENAGFRLRVSKYFDREFCLKLFEVFERSRKYFISEVE